MPTHSFPHSSASLTVGQKRPGRLNQRGGPGRSRRSQEACRGQEVGPGRTRGQKRHHNRHPEKRESYEQGARQKEELTPDRARATQMGKRNGY